jgi:hypothetical protein
MNSASRSPAHSQLNSMFVHRMENSVGAGNGSSAPLIFVTFNDNGKEKTDETKREG